MKSFTSILFASFAAYASVSASLARKHRTSTSSAVAVATAAANTATTGGTITRGASTVVMFEVGGIAGNECLTFRNNGNIFHFRFCCGLSDCAMMLTNTGEIVDAACVNTSADRQVTPSTNAAGDSVLLVQRSFTAGFRPDLVGKDVCVGFNGMIFWLRIVLRQGLGS